ncbi:unnamed protein product [Paramecium pentaurelia]|uniref:Uncharacterized protein n=1 Tax=Paramecium pentaurelia TaxID=43138 RepID=A0A8S1UPT4_9CILI|nr:unnamed protein product [Paramecium pentaurelia]
MELNNKYDNKKAVGLKPGKMNYKIFFMAMNLIDKVVCFRKLPQVLFGFKLLIKIIFQKSIRIQHQNRTNLNVN